MLATEGVQGRGNIEKKKGRKTVSSVFGTPWHVCESRQLAGGKKRGEGIE